MENHVIEVEQMGVVWSTNTYIITAASREEAIKALKARLASGVVYPHGQTVLQETYENLSLREGSDLIQMRDSRHPDDVEPYYNIKDES